MSGTFLSDFLLSVTDRGRALLGRSAEITGPKVSGLVEQCERVIRGRGEATGMAIACNILDGFAELSREDQLAFFRALAGQFGVDQERFRSALETWEHDSSDENAAALHFASEPRRQELFRRLNRAPGATAMLVEMRAAILRALPENPELASTDREMHHLLSSWFNRGFLVLRRIDWSTPAMVLDKIIRYEAVHEIRDWEDLRRRIDPPDRRCYAFFHPALADEPLIFVEVALTREVPTAIGPILSETRSPIATATAKTAVFYSISTCQDGLRGVSFGNFLIKQVADELANHLPQLSLFATLSPAPGFMRWLERLQRDDPAGLVLAKHHALLERLRTSDWHRDARTAGELKAVVMPLAAYYFLHAKDGRGEPVDPVARFHLGNGARLERINWLADRSEKSLARGAGLMVNYLYDRKNVEKNHEAFVNLGEIAVSGAVSKLLKPLSRASGAVKA